MALVPLTHQHLGSLDQGAAGAIIDAAIGEAIADLEDRGKDGKPRQVIIVVDLKIGSHEDIVDAHVEAGVKLPRRRTRTHLGKIKHNPDGKQRLLFQEYAPEDPHQRTLDSLAEGELPS